MERVVILSPSSHQHPGLITDDVCQPAPCDDHTKLEPILDYGAGILEDMIG